MIEKHDFQPDIDAIGRIGSAGTILDIVCRATGMGFAAIARVTDDRWITCLSRDTLNFGLEPGDELRVETTICNEIRVSREPVLIDHVDEDGDFRRHPAMSLHGFQSYVSMPIIRTDGSFFGTLCAIDPEPRKLRNRETVEMFRLFADLIASNLDAGERLERSESERDAEHETGRLREQFIAVVGHDLRNPVGAILSGTRLLLDTPLNGRATRIVTMMQGSALRMTNLIDNLLDFARGRIGGGIAITREKNALLEPVLQQVVDELRAVSNHAIETDFDLREPVDCDGQRMGQLFSNLLGNAVSHGEREIPITVSASSRNGTFTLSVANGGSPISPDDMEALFAPFARGGDRSDRRGLGLGLFIASEIAHAHGGLIDVASSAEETRFTFTMPSREPRPEDPNNGRFATSRALDR